MNILITICARGNNQGLPGKHLKEFCGKPLIQWTIEQAKEFANKQKGDISIIVNSDDSAILKLAKEFNLLTRKRPADLCSGNIPKIAILRDCYYYLDKKFDVVIDLDATNPLRTIEDIRGASDIHISSGINVLSAVHARKNPYFNQVEFKTQWTTPKMSNCVARQSCPQVLDLNASINIFSLNSVIINQSYTYTQFIPYIMPDDSFCDIDSQLDFDIAEMLMKRRLENGEDLYITK